MIEVQCLASGSSGNCYRITDGESPLLLDCGIPWRQIQQDLNFQASALSGILVSHEHMDHCRAVKNAVRSGVTCYASKETAEALGVSGHRVKIVRQLEQFRIDLWTVLPFDTVHDAAGSIGFLLAHKRGDKLLYLTDTAYCKYRFKGLTHILVEANYSLDILRQNVIDGSVPTELKNRLLKTHMGLETVKGFLRDNDLGRVREIWLLHLSSENSNSARFKREIQALTGKMVYVAGEAGGA